MRIPKQPTMIRRMLDSRLKKLAADGPIVAATFATYTHRCGRPSCRCHHGGPLHKGQHLTYLVDGKTRSIYVPKALIPEVRRWIARHRQLKELLKEIHQLSVALVHTHTKTKRLKAGRP